MDTITTTLRREPFADIVDGSKRVEYRRIKPYWTKRLRAVKTPFRLVLRNGLRLTIAGLALGAGSAVAATQLLARLLYGVTPTDPLTFTAAIATLLTAALIAAYVPARQAARLDAAAVLNRSA